MNPAVRFVVLFLASAGFLSYLPYRLVPFSKWKGAGIIGSLAGLALLMAFPEKGAVLWPATVLLAGFSIPISHWAEKTLESHDDPRIVIDEVIGMWLSALFLPRTPGTLVAAFVLFRFFDVWKGPWGRRAQRLPGGFGVVCDDLLAGFLANAAVRLIWYFR